MNQSKFNKAVEVLDEYDSSEKSAQKTSKTIDRMESMFLVDKQEIERMEMNKKLYLYQSEIHEVIQTSDKEIVIKLNNGNQVHITTEILDYGYDSKLKIKTNEGTT